MGTVVNWRSGESGRGVCGRKQIWNRNGKFGAEEEGQVSQACPRNWSKSAMPTIPRDKPT